MTAIHYDVFNGDADGILSLLQLRLADPRAAVLITGVKRDIELLQQVPLDAASVTVLDISMEKNQLPLQQLLAANIPVTYIDHHRAGEIPTAANLTAHIDLAPETCTALIVDQLLNGRFRPWAIAAAFGDNLLQQAQQLAVQSGFDAEQTAFLQELGTLINYNGYGRDMADLHIAPPRLFALLRQLASPFALQQPGQPLMSQLRQAFAADMAQVDQLAPVHDDPSLLMYLLPQQPWARRVSGVLGNQLANAHPTRAVAVLTENADGSLLVSLRAPLQQRHGAGTICSAYAGGGGREAAAGINALAAEKIPQFVASVIAYYRHG